MGATAAGPDRDERRAQRVEVLLVDPSTPDRHRRSSVPATAAGGNDALADAERLGVRAVVFAHGPPPPVATLASSIGRLAEHPMVAAELADTEDIDVRPAPVGGLPSIARLARRLGGRGAARAHRDGPTIALRVDAALDVGGFDPAFPGLGWADLFARLLADGWDVTGLAPPSLPFVEPLYRGLTPAERIRAEARWLQRHDPEPVGPQRVWPTRLARYRARVRVAGRLAGRGPGDGRGSGPPPAGGRDAARAEARRWWRDPAPQPQAGAGSRADWRFLLATGERRRTLVVTDAGDRWQWLVDDGWTERLSVTSSCGVRSGVDHSDVAGGAGPAGADVVVIDDGQPIGPGAGAVVEGGSVCVLRARRTAVERRRPAGAAEADQLAALGFGGIRRYLAVPDIERPKRLVPLDHPGGLDWLLTLRPPAAAGALSARNRRRRLLARLGRPAVDRVLGGVVVVGRRPRSEPEPAFAMAGLGPGDLPAATTDGIVVTSGFDEGSRAVLLPLGVERHPADEVVKISARPRYNANVDREAAVLAALRPAAGIGLVPRGGTPFAVGPLRASAESYAGRWSSADVLNEQDELAEQAIGLGTVMTAIARLYRETGGGIERWSSSSFEAHVGRWLDRLAERLGSSSTLQAFRSDLLERSDRLAGIEVPLVARHHDLGPWNVVFRDADPADGPGRSAVTIVDWELGPPRVVGQPGLAGADHLYFVKYWLHPVMGTRSLDDELRAFPFLASPAPDDPRRVARLALAEAIESLRLPGALVPLLAAHVWAEAACYTMERRRATGADPGSPGAYVLALARHRRRLLDAWPL